MGNPSVDLASQSTPGSAPPSVSPVDPDRHKRHLRNYLIDKGFQLRYVVFVTVLSSVLAGALGYVVWYQASYASKKIIQTLAKEEMSWLPIEMKAEIVDRLNTSDLNLVMVMAGAGLGLIAVLTLYLIIMTHKVAGPLYKMGQYFADIADGRLPVVRDLRRGDQLVDFFAKFKAMNEAVRERTQKEIETIDRFLAACEAAGASPSGELGHRLDELRSLRKKKQASLG